MADLGFLPVVRQLLDMTPPTGQRLLFSATLDGDVATLVANYLTDPAVHARRDRGRVGRHHEPPPATACRSRRSSTSSPRSRRAKAARCASSAPSTAPTASHATWPQGRPGRRAARRPHPGAAHSCARRVQGRLGAPCSSPPTSPRAGSTSTASRSSCTSTRRPTRRTTSTAPAARPAPVRAATVVLLATPAEERAARTCSTKAGVRAEQHNAAVGDRRRRPYDRRADAERSAGPGASARSAPRSGRSERISRLTAAEGTPARASLVVDFRSRSRWNSVVVQRRDSLRNVATSRTSTTARPRSSTRCCGDQLHSPRTQANTVVVNKRVMNSDDLEREKGVPRIPSPRTRRINYTSQFGDLR